ncbi:unnamed protein product [Paramecium pentaurelia]|uniref:Uncharacterized protein n=1 Tax=Paramecium pentaurelia TaxID=43138 RepID=A0A8S1UE75_9CILI|nr:unnamed protein product [Paramecium pentaurelia]
MKQDEIKKCFTSENHYKQTKQIKDYIVENNIEITQGAIQAVANILEDAKSQPIEKVLSTRLVKEIMDCHIALVIEIVQIKIMPIYEQILIQHCEKGQKAKQYYSNQPDEQLMVLGNTFIRLISECVFVWNIWHPNIDGQQSVYQRVYNNLVSKGMQFPKLFYFNSQKVKEFYIQSKEQMNTSPFVYSNNIQPDFFYIKKRLDGNQFQKSDLIMIRNELLCKPLINNDFQLSKVVNLILVKQNLSKILNQLLKILKRLKGLMNYKLQSNLFVQNLMMKYLINKQPWMHFKRDINQIKVISLLPNYKEEEVDILLIRLVNFYLMEV